ncbi:MAG TPA: hypothetical protein VM487_11455 [Phycisphaerae bacterium]|nr:hypothetical protein [Phycisphaerae bacterium]
MNKDTVEARLGEIRKAKEERLDRLRELDGERETVIAQVNSAMGAEQECLHWLAAFDSTDKAEVGEETPPASPEE